MILMLKLFGPFRDLEAGAQVTLELPEGAHVADLRSAFEAYGRQRWGERFPAGLLAHSVFATEHEVLRDAQALGDARELALLPPVSGG